MSFATAFACSGPGAAVGDERELARVVAALDGDEAQRARHVLVDDREDALGRLPRPTARPIASAIVCTAARAASTSSSISPPSRRGGRWPSTTFASVTVGSVAALAVCGGAGLRAGRLRADAERLRELGHVRDRAAAGADRVHVDRRHLDPEVADRGLAADRRLAVLAERDVRRRAAHVEGEDVVEARLARDEERACDAAGRAREDAVDRVARRLARRHQAGVGAQDVDVRRARRCRRAALWSCST